MAQTILEYGESSLGKTTSIGLFARYQFARTGLPTRLITCDSGFGPCQSEVDEGIIIPLRLEACEHPVPALNKLSKGLWPRQAIDVKEGVWRLDVNDLGYEPYVSKTGGIAIEGLTRISEVMRIWLLGSGLKAGVKGGEPPQGGGEVLGEEYNFQSRGTIGNIHQLIGGAVSRFRGLNVDRVLWTGHEGKGKDLNGRMVLGPATTGQAITDKVAGWFEIVLHHDSYRYQETSAKTGKTLARTAIRAWFQRHPDVDVQKLFWPAKLGLSGRLTSIVYSYWEEGYMPLIMDMQTGEYVQGIHTLLHMIDHDGALPGQLVEQPQEIATEQSGTGLEGAEETGEGGGADAAVDDAPDATQPVVTEQVTASDVGNNATSNANGGHPTNKSVARRGKR